MKPLIFILLIIAPCLLAGSCHKNPSCITSGGGQGGFASISVVPSHLDLFIDTCTIYIKYGTLDAPANGIYDDSQKCVIINDTPRATFTHLKPGIYYLFGKGYHGGYSPPYVKGAANYNMCSEQNASIYLPTYSYQP